MSSLLLLFLFSDNNNSAYKFAGIYIILFGIQFYYVYNFELESVVDVEITQGKTKDLNDFLFASLLSLCGHSRL